MILSSIKYVFLLKKDVPLNAIGYTIAVAINEAMCKDAVLKELHKAKTAKPYVFSRPQPDAENGFYKKNSMYQIQIKTCSREFAAKIVKLFEGFENEFIKSVMIQSKEGLGYKPVSELIALNPIIITLPKDERGRFDANKYANVKDRIIINLLKKYNFFSGENLTYDDVKDIFPVEQILGVPIPIKIKGHTYIGVRFKYKVADTPIANKLAYFAQYVGLGEKNAICGAGFCYAAPNKNREVAQ